MIAYHYPPIGGVAAQRPLKFSKYFPEFGWTSSILTVANDQTFSRDTSLISQIPQGQQIFRSFRIPIFSVIRKFLRKGLYRYHSFFTFVDSFFDWVPGAINLGKSIVERNKFDAIYATAPPYSSLRIAIALKKKTGLPIIADLRDPYSANEHINWPTRFHHKFYRIYESKILRKFDHVVVVHRLMQDDITDKMGISQSKVSVIPNGYDPDDFKSINHTPNNDVFLFGYVGSIYGKLTAEPFFASLSIALQERPQMRNRCRVVFMGNTPKLRLLKEAARYGVSDLIDIVGFQPHQEALKLMQKSHVLLLFGAVVLPNAIAMKMFEYAASERPTLSFGKEGIHQEYIKSNKFGFTVDSDDPQEGADRIIGFFDKFLQGKDIEGPSPEYYEKFSRKSQTRKLAGILDFLIDK